MSFLPVRACLMANAGTTLLEPSRGTGRTLTMAEFSCINTVVGGKRIKILILAKPGEISNSRILLSWPHNWEHRLAFQKFSGKVYLTPRASCGLHGCLSSCSGN